ncbi:hypothetical protein DPMN_179235 [Dreissena polymorpha]|uniref:Uncharacterized protein n=1 Tax=Dreissena polymorpha TaxID=45954 RepID=A0A9D4IM58_DREPO|nr:hypothetical protein DPMN_179235 [Dreissena polymorpha]
MISTHLFLSRQTTLLNNLQPATPNNDSTPEAQDDIYTIATPADNINKNTLYAKLLQFKARPLLVDGDMALFLRQNVTAQLFKINVI